MPEPKFNREDFLDSKENRQALSPDAQDLTEHLSELRDRLLISISVFLLFAILSFVFSETLIAFLESPAPSGTKFFQIKPGEIFLTSLKVAGFFGLIFSMPIWLWQLQAFLMPGLKTEEKKIISSIVNFSPLLFYLGIIFAYFALLPSVLEFLISYGSKVVETSFSLDYYLSLVISILAICGISFQIPIILITLGQLGLVNSNTLMKPWRYVILFAFLIAAILTPTPDPFTMSILAFALLMLYFITLLVLRMLRK